MNIIKIYYDNSTENRNALKLEIPLYKPQNPNIN